MNALYNEIEPFAATWIEELARCGHVAPGRVERRSIADLTAADVAGPGQRHFFAGIGGWSYALRLAGVRDDADIWTGSCPCQPFSAAGARGGILDPRHLWPAWFALIEQCRPPVIFGEQVASRDGLVWLDAVYADLERCGYAVGAADTCAAGVGAPHIRQRLYFVAYADEARLGELGLARVRADRNASRRDDADRCGEAGWLAYADDSRLEGWRGIGCPDQRNFGTHGVAGGMGHTGSDRDQQHARELPRDEGEHAQRREDGDYTSVDPGATRWSDCDWVPCTDGVSRPVEPGTFPLAHGVPARVGRLRGYGNAINAEQAATFVRAAMTTECCS